MPFYRCYYHVIWATKHRAPVIMPVYEPVITQAIDQKISEMQCQLLGINMVADHLHLAVVISPALAVAEAIRQLKGASSRLTNQVFPDDERFHWQEGYGVLSFGENALPTVLDYIARQKEHHANNTTITYLERIEV